MADLALGYAVVRRENDGRWMSQATYSSEATARRIASRWERMYGGLYDVVPWVCVNKDGYVGRRYSRG